MQLFRTLHQIFTYCTNISLPEHVTLLPVTEAIAKFCITTLRRSMCQHLHTFMQQVSDAASYVFLAYKHLAAYAKRADSQTVGCPTALQVLVHAKRSCITGQRSRC